MIRPGRRWLRGPLIRHASGAALALLLLHLTVTTAPASALDRQERPATRSATSPAEPAPEAGMAGRRLRARKTTLKLRVPAPRRSRSSTKTIRVHRRLSASEWRRRRLGELEVFMRLRRSDGVWSAKIGLERNGILHLPDGRRLAELRLAAEYSPRRGQLRYRIRVRNLSIPKRSYRRARITVRVTARYRF